MPISVAEGLASQWPLAAMWFAYAAAHSILASQRTKLAVTRLWPRFGPFYRLAYNAFALLALLPLAFWLHSRPGPVLWSFAGTAAWFANIAAALALVGIWRSAKYYDMGIFLGFKRESPLQAGAGGFRISPWHRFVRHPWYSLALVIIWTRDMNSAMLVTAMIVSAYFFVGSRWEESRLIAEFGDVYRRYCERVPGLLPWPGKYLSAAEAERLVAVPVPAESARR
jgi:protein-S-isoprenylcysteine O-methyltransferase Ste14